MPKLTLQSTMWEMEHIPELGAFSRYVMYTGGQGETPEQFAKMPIAGVKEMGWSPEGIVNGLNFLIESLENGRAKPYRVYAPEECAEDPQKADVNVVRLEPEKPDPARPYIVLCSGGAYQTVCSGAESYPTAAHFVKLGYQVFVVTYRIGGTRVLPKALDDVAAALRFIRARSEEFGLDPDAYAIAGWSAGGNLVCTWGTESAGWGAHGLPKPKAMFTVYPVADLDALDSADKDGMFLDTMFGPERTPEEMERCNPARNIDANYPPCYIVCGRDDATVACVQSETLKKLLDAAGVPAVLNEAEHAAHGFGDGTGTDAEGWPEAAIKFLESLK